MKIVHFLGWDNKCESPITYCVFHHISGHFSRQIKFWSILEKKVGIGSDSRPTLLHSNVNPTGLSLWVFCLIILSVTKTESEQ